MQVIWSSELDRCKPEELSDFWFGLVSFIPVLNVTKTAGIGRVKVLSLVFQYKQCLYTKEIHDFSNLSFKLDLSHVQHVYVFPPVLCRASCGVLLYYCKTSILLLSLLRREKVCSDTASNLLIPSGCGKVFGVGES